MSKVDELTKKTIHASVVNDAVLSGEVAGQVCSSLGLATTNATLGRKVVSLALLAMDKADSEGGMVDGLDIFSEQATQYGSLGPGMLQDIYEKVTTDPW